MDSNTVPDDHMAACSVDGCQNEAVAELLTFEDRPFRCERCLEYDLDL